MWSSYIWGPNFRNCSRQTGRGYIWKWMSNVLWFKKRKKKKKTEMTTEVTGYTHNIPVGVWCVYINTNLKGQPLITHHVTVKINPKVISVYLVSVCVSLQRTSLSESLVLPSSRPFTGKTWSLFPLQSSNKRNCWATRVKIKSKSI